MWINVLISSAHIQLLWLRNRQVLFFTKIDRPKRETRNKLNTRDLWSIRWEVMSQSTEDDSRLKWLLSSCILSESAARRLRIKPPLCARPRGWALALVAVYYYIRRLQPAQTAKLALAPPMRASSIYSGVRESVSSEKTGKNSLSDS